MVKLIIPSVLLCDLIKRIMPNFVRRLKKTGEKGFPEKKNPKVITKGYVAQCNW